MKKTLILTTLLTLSACTCNTEDEGFETRLWYDAPAQAWTEAIPIGNSHLGGMVYGGTVHEEIQLNEETFWAGGPGEVNNEDALKVLPQVRKLVFNNELDKARDVINDNFYSESHGMRYLTLGSLHIEINAGGNVTDYRRELNLGEAIQKTAYTAGNVKFERTADTPGFRRIAGTDFIDGLVDCLFARTEKLSNFVHAMSAKGKSLGSEILSLLVFIEQGYKQLLLGCEHFWRSVRNHYKYRRIVFKFTNFSPVLLIYIIDNHIISHNLGAHLEASSDPLDDIMISYHDGLTNPY